MSNVTMQAAAQAAVFLSGRNADDIGWPDHACVARHFAAAVLGGLGTEQYGADPVTWCVQTLEPAIQRRLPGPDDEDLRSIGWPHTPTVARTLVGWLVEDGVISDSPS